MSNIRQRMLARKKEKANKPATLATTAPVPTPPAPPAVRTTPATPEPVETSALGKGDITLEMLNTEQLQGVKLMARPANARDSFVLMGAAGSGKTTAVNLGIKEAIFQGAAKKYENSKEDLLSDSGNNSQPPTPFDPTREYDEHYFANAVQSAVLKRGAPRIAVVSYTNVAVRNIKEILPEALKPHCTTVHKLLGYAPEEMEVEVTDAQGIPTGEVKVVKPFVPRYGVEPTTHGGRGYGIGEKLAHLDMIVIEEAGTVPVWLYMTLVSALPDPQRTKFVFLGDIQQQDPAFGDGILGYKMLELPGIELRHTYRNVGLITRFAHRILEGRPIGPAEAKTWNRAEGQDSIEMMPFKKSAYPDVMNMVVGKTIKNRILEGTYDEHKEVVLIPFNKEFGTIELNKWIMQGIAERDNLKVHEVITNREHHYFCVGDKVLHNKQYYEVKEIKPNPTYTGTTKPFPASKFIDRWGRRRLPRDFEQDEYDLEREALANLTRQQKMTSQDAENFLSQLAVDDEQGSNAASHELILRPWSDGHVDTDVEDNEFVMEAGDITIKSASHLNSLVLPYALTVHKAQGSEFNTVWLILHRSHAVALKRELFYTGVTRARQHLKLLYSDVTTTGSTTHDSLTKAIVRQAIPGLTLEEKKEHFRKKLNVDSEKQRLRELREKYNFGKSAEPQEI